MGLMCFVLLVYYGLFITFTPFVTTEQHGAIKHGHINNFDNLSPEINREHKFFDEYEPSKDGKNAGYRHRRTPSTEVHQSSAPTTSDSGQSSTSSRPSSTTIGSYISKKKDKDKQASVSSVTDRFKITKARFFIGQQESTSTTELPDSIPDFQLSNHLIDSVFTAAEAAGMKEPLGLCRKNTDVKVPEVKATLFPSDQAGEILNCINDLLRNQTKKQICLHLDPEMNAYLKWLLMTGESRERHKPVKISSKEDFLFPSTCVSTSETDSAGKATTQCFAEPQDRADFNQK